MHNITSYRDPWGKLVIVSAVATAPLHDPLEGLTSSQRFEVCRLSLSRSERQVLRAARRIPRDQQRVVLHYILTDRRVRFEEHKATRIREATRARRQDIVDDENARTRRHGNALRLEAERRQQQMQKDQGQSQS